MRAGMAEYPRDDLFPHGRGRVIRTLDPRFPKPVLYQAELYPECGFHPILSRAAKGKGKRGDLRELTPVGEVPEKEA